MESGYAVVFLKAMRDTSIARVSGGACPHDFTYALRFIYIYIYLPGTGVHLSVPRLFPRLCSSRLQGRSIRKITILGEKRHDTHDEHFHGLHCTHTTKPFEATDGIQLHWVNQRYEIISELSAIKRKARTEVEKGRHL